MSLNFTGELSTLMLFLSLKERKESWPSDPPKHIPIEESDSDDYLA